MASKEFRDPKIRGGGRVIIEGSWATNLASAIDQTLVKGKGFSVLYTSTGLHTITFDDAFPDLPETFLHGIQMSVATDIKTQAGLYVIAARTMQIRTLAVAALTDVAANANNRISFLAVFKNTLAY